MNQYIILCRSLTYAQRAKRLLELQGISSAIIKIPQSLTPEGCGYGLSLHKYFDQAVVILKNNNLLRGKVFKREKGEYREMLV